MRILATYHRDSFNSWWAVFTALFSCCLLLFSPREVSLLDSPEHATSQEEHLCLLRGLLLEGNASLPVSSNRSKPATSLVTGSWKQSSSHKQQIIKDYNYATSRSVISVPWTGCRMSSQSFTFILRYKAFFSSTHSRCIPAAPLNLYKTTQGIKICSFELNCLWLHGFYTDLLFLSCLLQMKWAVWTQTSVKGSVELQWAVPTSPTPNSW